MAEAKDKSAGLIQPESQNPVKPKEDTNPVPPSIREHKAVPAHPYVSTGKNLAYEGDANAKPKTMDECVAEHKARQSKK